MPNINEEQSEPSFAIQVFEWIWDIFIVLIIVYLIITFVVQNTKVSGHSMEPTLHNNDAVIVNKFIYHFKTPHQGDIIVFPYQKDPSKKYIKRIIGLPGDIIDIENGMIYINGQILHEPYIIESWNVKGNISYPFKIPENTYFVMGDNRDYSADSRFQDVGTVQKSEIFGKAWIRIWPLKNIGAVK